MNCPCCDKPIDEHEAGRETDACVAEAVMGEDVLWQAEWKTIPDGPVSRIGYAMSLEKCERLCAEKKDDFRPVPSGNKNYSTDIATAWEVVGRILEKWLIEINTIDESLIPDMMPQISWSVTIAEEYNSGGSAIWKGDFADFTEANTAPLAICRAVLKAVGGEEDG